MDVSNQVTRGSNQITEGLTVTYIKLVYFRDLVNSTPILKLTTVFQSVKKEVTFSMPIGNWNPCKSVLQNT